MMLIVKICTEHITTYILQRHITMEMAPFIYNRENISFRCRHHLHKLAKGSIDLHRNEVTLNQIAGLQQGQHSLVAVVSQKLSPLCNTFCIDRIWLHGPCRRV